MLEINNPLSKLKEQLEDKSTLKDFGINITQGELVNENPNRAPWLGIYTVKVSHNPESIGTSSRRWKGDIELVLVVQAVSLKGGLDCYKLLEKYVKEVVSSVLGDTTFGNSIDLVESLDVDYSYNRTDSSTLHFQEAYISLKVVTEHEDNC
jgi:hypothetical protein